jgi:hypothetical protein
METKKHALAEKKLKGALATFTTAAKEIEGVIELKRQSVEQDEARLIQIENQIAGLEKAHDQIQSNILVKQGEIKKHAELSLKLGEFSL